MTASEVRDRLDQRLRLLVGSRRALERHHTLRHAVGVVLRAARRHGKDAAGPLFGLRGRIRPPKRLRGSADPRRPRRLRRPGSARCSGAQVAAGGRPVSRADPVFDAGDDPPVRRGTTRRPRRSIRDSGRPLAVLRRTRSRHHGPVGQPPPARGLRLVHSSSWPICAPRFAGPPTTAIWMSPPPSPPMWGGSALCVQTLEPVAWAEELIEPARAVDHPRLAFLYVIASCATRPDGSRRLSATATPARSFSAGAARRRRTASEPGLELYT